MSKTPLCIIILYAGGSSITLMIVNICPDVPSMSETLSSLNFSSRARNAMLSLGNRDTIKKWKDIVSLLNSFSMGSIDKNVQLLSSCCSNRWGMQKSYVKMMINLYSLIFLQKNYLAHVMLKKLQLICVLDYLLLHDVCMLAGKAKIKVCDKKNVL